MKKEFWVLVDKRIEDNKKLFKRFVREVLQNYDFVTKFETEEQAIKARDSGLGESDDVIKKVTINIEIG